MFQSNNIQELISNEDYNLLMGAKPFTPELIPVAYVEREAIFNLIINEDIEYRYINGSCEDRAHYISLLLKKNGVTCGKSWNFAPARYTFISNELFTIKDPFGIVDQITWGYHVAPYLLSYNEYGNIETLIIDQSFKADGFMTIDQWFEKMECPRAINLLTNTESYLFNSLFGNIGDYNGNFETSYNTPLDIPSVITGNFWELLPGDDHVQKGLAINDLAIEIFKLKNTLPEDQESYLRYVLTSIDELIKLSSTAKPDVLYLATFEYIIGYYWERYYHWGNKIAQLTC